MIPGPCRVPPSFLAKELAPRFQYVNVVKQQSSWPRGLKEAAMLGAKAVARAKINLFLEVGALRQDGYHDIRSVMQSLELSDELYFRRTDGSGGKIVIRCNDPHVPATEGNLVYKAIEAFDAQTESMSGEGVEVLINKRIPAGAGLAGGSADAAAALQALNFIYELDIPTETLSEIGARIGSDVPFCILGGTSLVSGRGEKVEPLEALPPYQVVLASTGDEVSTRDVYERFDSLGAEAKPVPEEMKAAFGALLDGIRDRDFKAIYLNLRNSLESATIATGQVESYKDVALKAGASAALMTGSGPTVFALVSGMEQAAEVAWELEKAAPITIVTSFSSRGAEVSAV
jgi:4-diphosphocytidyl-2-C-methyl-D-erythritol kinase